METHTEHLKEMKALYFDRYATSETISDNITIKTLPIPTIGDDEVLIRVKAASLNAVDWKILTAQPFFIRLVVGLFKPKWNIIGRDVSGIIDKVGSKVKTYKVGDEIYGELAFSQNGSFAEYATSKEEVIAFKPKNMNYEQSASIPLAGLTALQVLRDKAHIAPKQKILIYGASGGLGNFAIQFAQLLGGDITAVCSTRNISIVQDLGVSEIIDYRSHDPVDHCVQQNKKFDVVLLVNGQISFKDCKKLLEKNGKAILVGGANAMFFNWMLFSKLHTKCSKNNNQFFLFMSAPNHEDLNTIREYVENEKITPRIDKVFPLEDTLLALDHMLNTHAQGKVVITI